MKPAESIPTTTSQPTGHLLQANYCLVSDIDGIVLVLIPTSFIHLPTKTTKRQEQALCVVSNPLIPAALAWQQPCTIYQSTVLITAVPICTAPSITMSTLSSPSHIALTDNTVWCVWAPLFRVDAAKKLHHPYLDMPRRPPQNTRRLP